MEGHGGGFGGGCPSVFDRDARAPGPPQPSCARKQPGGSQA